MLTPVDSSQSISRPGAQTRDFRVLGFCARAIGAPRLTRAGTSCDGGFESSASTIPPEGIGLSMQVQVSCKRETLASNAGDLTRFDARHGGGAGTNYRPSAVNVAGREKMPFIERPE